MITSGGARIIIESRQNFTCDIIYELTLKPNPKYTLSNYVATACFPQLIISYRYLFNICHRKNLEDQFCPKLTPKTTNNFGQIPATAKNC
jgi:hypothetical protein